MNTGPFTSITEATTDTLRTHTQSLDAVGRTLDAHNRTFMVQSELFDGHTKRLDAMFYTIFVLAIVVIAEGAALIVLAVSP